MVTESGVVVGGASARRGGGTTVWNIRIGAVLWELLGDSVLGLVGCPSKCPLERYEDRVDRARKEVGMSGSVG